MTAAKIPATSANISCALTPAPCPEGVAEGVPSETGIFNRYESSVRSYCRAFPAVFARARGAELYTDGGAKFIDFLSGAGALNYGHNNPMIKAALLDYIGADGVTQGLDLHTAAKRNFLERFTAIILEPRGLDFKVQFCGPTGTNAVEAALKLARLVTGRPGIFAFMGAYHGMSLASLAVTGNRSSRAGAGVSLSNVTFIPFECGPRGCFDSLRYMRNALEDPNSGIEPPAAIIVETVQAEGGVYVASREWLRGLADLCRDNAILLICDEIQTGCGRTGSFFSFERAGIVPDIVTLSKSLGGYGLPMSLVLMKRDLDVWTPGAHTGTFRGHQLAFVAATAALSYWERGEFQASIELKATFLRRFLARSPFVDTAEVRGLGMIWGIDLASHGSAEAARAVSRECFRRGLIVECCGRDDTVIKLLPPLTIPLELLEEGCAILEEALRKTQ